MVISVRGVILVQYTTYYNQKQHFTKNPGRPHPRRHSPLLSRGVLKIAYLYLYKTFCRFARMKRQTRIMVNRIREVLVGEPVQKAWLFGSYARGQEGPESDVDLLVQMAPNDLTILGFLKIQTRLEKVTNRPVDLIEDECLEDFARPSADNDKILIYESA